MKKIVIIVASALIVLFFVYMYRKRKSIGTTTVSKDQNANLVPVDTDKPENNEMLFTDSGNGAIAIATRMQQLKEGGEYVRQAGKLDSGILFSGLENPEIFSSQIGGVSSISFPLSDKSMLALSDGSSLECRSANSSDSKIQIMRNIQKINDSFLNSGLPEFLAYEYKGGGEKNFFKGLVSSYGNTPSNYDLSKNNPKWVQAGMKMQCDVKKLCQNILSVNNELNTKVRQLAINDLIAAGWKFVGYSQQ